MSPGIPMVRICARPTLTSINFFGIVIFCPQSEAQKCSLFTASPHLHARASPHDLHVRARTCTCAVSLINEFKVAG